MDNVWVELGIGGRNSYHVSERMVDMRRPQRATRAVELEALPQRLIIDASRTAVIVIDMQNDFCSPNGWLGSLGVDTGFGSSLVAPINRLTACARANAMPVIWLSWGVRPDRLNLSPSTRHPFSPTGAGPGLAGEFAGPDGAYGVLQEGGWGAALLDDLVQHDDDIHIAKHRISGFWDTPLDAILRNHAISTLLFAGVNADHCVLGTLMDANFSGYDTIMVEDCVGTSSPDFCMQATLHNVRFCFGFTTTSEALEAGLSG